MTPSDFKAAVVALQERGTIPAGHGWKSALAKTLGVNRITIDRFLRNGTTQTQTDYAIAALLAGLKPHGGGEVQSVIAQ